MKKTFGVAVVVLHMAFQSHAFMLTSYFTGAWWDTSATKGFTRSAGELDLYFYDDLVVTADLFYNGALVNMGSGTYTVISSNYWKVSFTTTNNVQFVGTVRNSIGKGTSKTIPPSGFRGQWQVN